MKGAAVESVGAKPQVLDNLEKPTPGSDQILVKSLWTAINPVDNYMVSYGLLVVDWPLIIGVDASGVVVEAGATAKSKYGFQSGDYVFGCTRLGSKGFSTGQEYFLMDAQITMRKPKNISLVQAATLGVGTQTACLGLFNGLKLELPDTAALPKPKDESVVVLGGASSVGKAAIQIARACGYSVIASCSKTSAEMVQGLGATTFDYKSDVNDQVQQVLKASGGDVSRIFDAGAVDDLTVAKELFKSTKTTKPKLFSTTNDWSGYGDFEGGKTDIIALGPIGRPGAEELNEKLESYTPVIVDLVEAGALVPAEYQVIGEGGFEDVIKAFEHQSKGAGGSKKVVVKIQDE